MMYIEVGVVAQACNPIYLRGRDQEKSQFEASPWGGVQFMRPDLKE
jgi:hypothetical protein